MDFSSGVGIAGLSDEEKGLTFVNNNNHSGPPIGVLGLGVAVPDKILTNQDLEKMVDTNDEWIVSRTGIRERRVLSDGEVPSDMAVIAAHRALEDAGVAKEEIDAVIYCTYTPDHYMPPTACIVQSRMGLPGGMAYDLNAACTGFVYGLQNSYAMLRAGLAKKILLIGCDASSRIMNYKDRETCILFGDGAGAVIVGEVPEGRGILGNHAGSDSKGAYLIYQKIGAGGYPLTDHNVNDPERYMKMHGREVFKFAAKIVAETVDAALHQAGMTSDQLDLLVPHQANIRIIHSAMARYHFDESRTVICMDKYGNTSSASIPLALDHARKEGKLKQGTACALVAFGAGLTYAATILKW